VSGSFHNPNVEQRLLARRNVGEVGVHKERAAPQVRREEQELRERDAKWIEFGGMIRPVAPRVVQEANAAGRKLRIQVVKRNRGSSACSQELLWIASNAPSHLALTSWKSHWLVFGNSFAVGLISVPRKCDPVRREQHWR
jgi:hypothetical protein